MRRTRTFIYALLVIFFGLLITSFIFGWINSGINIIDLIGMLSSVVVAILTAYTLITSDKQLNITVSQLKEMERSTNFSAQPLPVIAIERIYFEKPRAFYAPPYDEYSGSTRLFADFSIQNYGTQPATNVIVSGFVIIFDEKENKFHDSMSIQIDTLGTSNDEKSPVSSRQGDFMFVLQSDFSIISSLRQMKFDTTPNLLIAILYKNILGGCFFESWQYKLYLRNEQDEATLKNWHSKMNSFHIEYSSEIKTLRKLKRSDGNEWNVEFEKLKNLFSASAEQREVELSYSLIPNSYTIKPITEDEYKKRTSKVYFGSPVPSWLDECVALPQDEGE